MRKGCKAQDTLSVSRVPGHVLGKAEVARLALTQTPTIKSDAQLAQLAEGAGCNQLWRTRHSLTEESGVSHCLWLTGLPLS